jgi:NADH-quinone oxidoreductase subunit J
VDGYLLLALAVLGAVGVYLLLPGGRRRPGGVGLIAIAAAAAVLVITLTEMLTGGGRAVVVPGLALIGLWGAVRVITHSRPVYSALYFILVVVSTAGLLLVAQAEFVAAALLIIYAGAILVTYVFVIMLAQQAGGSAPYDQQAREPFLGCVTGFLLLGLIALRVLQAPTSPPDAIATAVGDARAVGVPLLTTFAIALQIAGLLLLASMVGAIAIARRRPNPPEGGEA